MRCPNSDCETRNILEFPFTEKDNKLGIMCFDTGGKPRFVEAKFCPACGIPLDEEEYKDVWIKEVWISEDIMKKIEVVSEMTYRLRGLSGGTVTVKITKGADDED